MVKVTTQALAVIRTVTAHPALGPASGLEITGPQSSGTQLSVAAVPAPSADADVVETGGGRLFLGPGVAGRLREHEIDVEDDELGRKQFVLREAS